MNITKKDFSKLPMLKFILDKFSEDFEEPTKDIKELKNKMYGLYEELKKDFTPEQKKLIEKYQDLESDTRHKELEKIFVMGFLIGSNLSKELDVYIPGFIFCSN